MSYFKRRAGEGGGNRGEGGGGRGEVDIDRKEEPVISIIITFSTYSTEEKVLTGDKTCNFEKSLRGNLQ